MRSLSVVLAVVVLGLLAGPASGQVPEPLPSQAEVQALVDTGNYPEALKRLVRLLALNGKAAEGYDRYELLMLRGEALLQSKQTSTAIDAFGQARKEAKNDAAAAVAIATEQLVKRASNFIYTSKGKDKMGQPQKFNVLDRATRKNAFLALFEDDFATLDPKVRAARQATSLTALLEVGQSILPLRALELAATDDNVKIKEALQGLGQHAKDLMTAALATMERTTASIENQANTNLTRVVNVQDPNNPKNTIPQTQYCKRGLDDGMTRSLNDTIATCERLPLAVKALNLTLSIDPAQFTDTLTAAGRLRARAVTIRDTEYNPQPNTISIH